MSKRTRRRHTPEQKAVLIRQHVVEKKPVSEICSVAQIQPSVFYKWERDLLEAAPALFAGRRAPSREQELEVKIAALETVRVELNGPLAFCAARDDRMTS
ncbi:MAG: transposase [Acidobacteria bacterium]|nr:transposase [Acidobacteriota bacterium]